MAISEKRADSLKNERVAQQNSEPAFFVCVYLEVDASPG